MTDLDKWLDEVEKRCEAATDGPWRSDFVGEPVAVCADFVRKEYPDLVPVAVLPEMDVELREGLDWIANIKFIAHARIDLPRALRIIRTMKAALEKIQLGEGPFSNDQLTFASNTIEAMKNIARASLRGETGGDE